MIRLEPKQWEQVLTVGKEKMQINIEKEQIISLEHLYHKIAKTDNEKISDLLNYQFYESKHKNTFLMVFMYNINRGQIITQEKKDICSQWFINNCEFRGLYFDKIMDFFYDFRKKKPNEIEEWKRRLEDLIYGKDSSKIIPFLKFGLDMLKDGYTLHKIICKSQINCSYDITFEDKIETTNLFLKSITEKETTIPLEQNTKVATAPTYDKIQWLGTQKQLAELFIELQKKGWIEGIKYDAIKKCFTKSNTINQVLKPSINSSNGYDPEYDQVYTTNYSPSYYGIKENPKAKK